MRSLTTALLATVLLAGCSGNDNAPSPTPTQVQGLWRGTSTVTGCSETGAGAAGACNGWAGTNSTLQLNLTQSGSTLSGTLTTGSFLINITGSISGNTVTLSGQGKQLSTTFNLSSWNSTVSGSSMAGSFRYSVVPDDFRLGSITVSHNFSNIVR